MQLRSFAAWAIVTPLLAVPTVTEAQTVSNSVDCARCMNNTRSIIQPCRRLSIYPRGSRHPYSRRT